MRLLEMLFVSSSDKYMWLDNDVADKNCCITWIVADLSQKLVFCQDVQHQGPAVACFARHLLLPSANYPSHGFGCPRSLCLLPLEVWKSLI